MILNKKINFLIKNHIVFMKELTPYTITANFISFEEKDLIKKENTIHLYKHESKNVTFSLEKIESVEYFANLEESVVLKCSFMDKKNLDLYEIALRYYKENKNSLSLEETKKILNKLTESHQVYIQIPKDKLNRFYVLWAQSKEHIYESFV